MYCSNIDIARLRSDTEQGLMLLNDWFCANKLSLNVQKTNFMIFRPNHRRADDTLFEKVSLGNEQIRRITSAKFLGIIVDDRMEWGEHIDYVASKIASGAYALNAAKKHLPKSALKLIYYSLVHSYLTYGTILWGSATQYKLNRIIVNQKKCIRKIAGIGYRDHTQPFFKSYKILNCHEIYQIQLGKLMYRYNSYMLPAPLQAIFTPNNEIHNYETRSRNFPHATKIRLNLVLNSFVHQAPKFWSEIPIGIRNAPSLASFKFKIKQFIFQRNN